jgi:hypothetical protein
MLTSLPEHMLQKLHRRSNHSAVAFWLSVVLPLDWDAPKPIVELLRFDSIDKAQAWYNSAAYQAILPVRKDNTKSNFFVVEGVPQ